MRNIIFLLIAMILSAGCIQSPANVARGMPEFWDNASRSINNISEPIQEEAPSLEFGNNSGMPDGAVIVVVKL